mmetsp:Transcript_920/g.1311  ORF Transcript_920/g.1311 Transcript_920/m.1311 type:complete len:231 (-) Transcript_920:38-730(-)
MYIKSLESGPLKELLNKTRFCRLDLVTLVFGKSAEGDPVNWLECNDKTLRDVMPPQSRLDMDPSKALSCNTRRRSLRKFCKRVGMLPVKALANNSRDVSLTSPRVGCCCCCCEMIFVGIKTASRSGPAKRLEWRDSFFNSTNWWREVGMEPLRFELAISNSSNASICDSSEGIVASSENILSLSLRTMSCFNNPKTGGSVPRNSFWERSIDMTTSLGIVDRRQVIPYQLQ